MVDQKLVDYIRYHLDKGYSKDAIVGFLERQGYTIQIIEEALNLIQNSNHFPEPEPQHTEPAQAAPKEQKAYQKDKIDMDHLTHKLNDLKKMSMIILFALLGIIIVLLVVIVIMALGSSGSNPLQTNNQNQNQNPDDPPGQSVVYLDDCGLIKSEKLIGAEDMTSDDFGALKCFRSALEICSPSKVTLWELNEDTQDITISGSIDTGDEELCKVSSNVKECQVNMVILGSALTERNFNDVASEIMQVTSGMLGQDSTETKDIIACN